MGIDIGTGISIGTGINIGNYNANVLPQFPNGDFSQGFLGWELTIDQIFWSGGSTLAGWPTPVLPTPLPYAPNQKNWDSWSQVPGYSVTLNADKPTGNTGQSADLFMGANGVYGSISPAGGTAYGPALTSTNTVGVIAGDSVAFDWRGISTTDAYSIYAYLVNVDNGLTFTLLRATNATVASTSWATSSTVVSVSGDYKFVFVAGCWDSTLGRAIGAQFRLTNIRRIPQ